jgi:CRP/FNR family transcriptional regulator, cyclic AMP receptor protein
LRINDEILNIVTSYQYSAPSKNDFFPEVLLQKGGKMLQFESNQKIEAGDYENGYYFITYGVIKSHSSDKQGNPYFIEVLKRGDYFKVQFDTIKDFEFKSIVPTKSMAVFIPTEQVENLLLNDVEFARFSNRLNQLQQERRLRRYLLNLSLPIKENLELFIKELALEGGSKKGLEIVIQNYLSHQEIAQYLHSSRQTISLLFNQLRDQEKIDYSRKLIRIKDLSYFEL